MVNETEYNKELKAIGKQLIELRKASGYTSYKPYAEQVLKINPSTYQRIENGSGNYTILNLLKIVSCYPGLKLSDLIKKSGA